MPDATPSELELDESAMRQLVDEAMARLMPVLTQLETQPVHPRSSNHSEFLSGLVEGPPAQGTPFEALLDHLFVECLPTSLNATAPGFMGYVPGGGLFHAAVADLIADALNRYVGVSAVAGGFAQIEANVVRWFCQWMGLPETAAGFLCSGGSLANWSAVVVAREHKLGEDFADGVVYTSDQAHHCVAKAVRLAGLRAGNLRVLPTDETRQLDPVKLQQAIQVDRAAGLRPFMLVASAGTTNTGVIDRLTELAAVASAEALWFHVDGAYGGFFHLTQRGQARMAGIELADSIVLDPHKALFLPYGTGALLVRQADHLKFAHTAEAAYLPASSAQQDVWEFADLSPELTRPFRGLRVWLPLKLHGVDVFRRYLDEKLDLAEYLAQRLRSFPQLEVLSPPQLSIVAFVVAKPKNNLALRNEQTQQLLTWINARQNVLLTSTELTGLFVIRAAIVSFRTHARSVDQLVQDLTSGIAELGL